MKRPTRAELDAIEVRAARVAMEGFMLTLRDGLKPFGEEGEKAAVLDFFGETLHQHAAIMTGAVPGKLLFTFHLEPQWKPPLPAKGGGGAFEMPTRCRVGPVLQALVAPDCHDAALVVCVDASESTWVACARPEHQKGAVTKEPIADFLTREGWLPGGEKT